MLRRLKAVTEAREDGNLAAAMKASAQQIWLAGLEAFAKKPEQGCKVFEAPI
ncbi:MAG: phasin family protein [Sutterellaceae bacterium]|nr:phasin family protein [Burkholderiaceae bacterium]MCX7902692.1 phasin family protein [Burkholderiaceae bacterium]MDW8429260.1 phasin family protein [Sutterellaceae bacterium]